MSIEDLRNLIIKMEESDYSEGIISDSDTDKISVPFANGFKIVDLRNLMHIDSDNSYSELHLTDGERLVVSCSIKEFEFALIEKGFFRVHNKHLINLKYLETFALSDGGTVTLINGVQLPVSRRRITDFKQEVKKKFSSPKT